MKLWHADDPARPPTLNQPCPDGDTLGTRPVSAPGEATGSGTVSPCPDVIGTRGTGTRPIPPPLIGNEWYPNHLADAARNGHLTQAEFDEQLALHRLVEKALET
jgi:hypothetical protein